MFSRLYAMHGFNLQLKLTKCHFAQREVNYLGHNVPQEGIRPATNKVEAVSEYPTPKTVKEVKQFLGLTTNYYHQLILGYAKIAEPLYKVLQKANDKFHWDPNCQLAFDQLKQMLTTPHTSLLTLISNHLLSSILMPRILS